MQNEWRIKEVIATLDHKTSQRLVLVGEYLCSIAKANSLVDKGFLRSSNYSKLIDALKVRIGNSAFYATFIERGTGEYEENGQGRKGGWYYTTSIPQGKGKPLGITNDGKFLYFTFGMKPNPFIRPLLSDHKDAILRILTT